MKQKNVGQTEAESENTIFEQSVKHSAPRAGNGKTFGTNAQTSEYIKQLAEKISDILTQWLLNDGAKEVNTWQLAEELNDSLNEEQKTRFNRVLKGTNYRGDDVMKAYALLEKQNGTFGTLDNTTSKNIEHKVNVDSCKIRRERELGEITFTYRLKSA